MQTPFDRGEQPAFLTADAGMCLTTRTFGTMSGMRHDTAIPARQPAADPRFAEVPPDRDRPGWWEHPNIDRPGARPHPA
ncbi:MAG TPA: hypothetical protein VLU41_07050, partial [Ideonella sp.]|nr:hypothetical protein [Ideonella sp.]